MQENDTVAVHQLTLKQGGGRVEFAYSGIDQGDVPLHSSETCFTSSSTLV